MVASDIEKKLGQKIAGDGPVDRDPGRPDVSLGALCGRPTNAEDKDGFVSVSEKKRKGLCLPSVLTYLLPSNFTRIFSEVHRAFYSTEDMEETTVVDKEEADKCAKQAISAEKSKEKARLALWRCETITTAARDGSRLCDAEFSMTGILTREYHTSCKLKDSYIVRAPDIVSFKDAAQCRALSSSMDRCDRVQCSVKDIKGIISKDSEESSPENTGAEHEMFGPQCRKCGDLPHCKANYIRGGGTLGMNKCICDPNGPEFTEPPITPEAKLPVGERDVHRPYLQMMKRLIEYGCPPDETGGTTSCDQGEKKFYPMSSAEAQKRRAETAATKRANDLKKLSKKTWARTRFNVAGETGTGSDTRFKAAAQESLFQEFKAKNRFVAEAKEEEIETSEQIVNLPYPNFLASDESFNKKVMLMIKATEEFMQNDEERSAQNEAEIAKKRSKFGKNYGGEVLSLSGKIKVQAVFGAKVSGPPKSGFGAGLSLYAGKAWAFSLKAKDYGKSKKGKPAYEYSFKKVGDGMISLKAKITVALPGHIYVIATGSLDETAADKCGGGGIKFGGANTTWKAGLMILLVTPRNVMKEFVDAFKHISEQEWFRETLRLANAEPEDNRLILKAGDNYTVTHPNEDCEYLDGGSELKCKICKDLSHCDSTYMPAKLFGEGVCKCKWNEGVKVVNVITEDDAAECEKHSKDNDNPEKSSVTPTTLEDTYGPECRACHLKAHCKARFFRIFSSRDIFSASYACKCSAAGPIAAGSKDDTFQSNEEIAKCALYYKERDACTTKACTISGGGTEMGPSCEKCKASGCKATYNRGVIYNRCECGAINGKPSGKEVLMNLLGGVGEYIKKEGTAITARLAANAMVGSKLGLLSVIKSSAVNLMFMDLGCEGSHLWASQRLMITVGESWSFGLELGLEAQFSHLTATGVTFQLDSSKKSNKGVSTIDRIKKAFAGIHTKISSGAELTMPPGKAGTAINVTLKTDTMLDKFKDWMKQGYASFVISVEKEFDRTFPGDYTCGFVAENIGKLFAQTTTTAEELEAKHDAVDDLDAPPEDDFARSIEQESVRFARSTVPTTIESARTSAFERSRLNWRLDDEPLEDDTIGAKPQRAAESTTEGGEQSAKKNDAPSRHMRFSRSAARVPIVVDSDFEMSRFAWGLGDQHLVEDGTELDGGTRGVAVPMKSVESNTETADGGREQPSTVTTPNVGDSNFELSRFDWEIPQ